MNNNLDNITDSSFHSTLIPDILSGQLVELKVYPAVINIQVKNSGSPELMWSSTKGHDLLSVLKRIVKGLLIGIPTNEEA